MIIINKKYNKRDTITVLLVICMYNKDNPSIVNKHSYIILCYTILYYSVLCYGIPCYTMIQYDAL